MKRFSDRQIKEWNDRYDLQLSRSDARQAFEDAASQRREGEPRLEKTKPAVGDAEGGR